MLGRLLGALALFGIFAGRMSCNKRPHTRHLLLHYHTLILLYILTDIKISFHIIKYII